MNQKIYLLQIFDLLGMDGNRIKDKNGQILNT
jgi:hypothetical protein